MGIIKTIITSALLYCGTAVDLLVILMHFFAKIRDKNGIKDLYIGQFIGSGLLILISLFFAYILHFIPEKHLLGLLGIIPIFLGLNVLIVGESDGEELAHQKLNKPQKLNLIKNIIFITIVSCGSDNIGLFVPYFISLSPIDLLITLIVFVVMIFLLVFTAHRLTDIPLIGSLLEKYSQWFIAIIYITLGISILIENRSIDFLIGLLSQTISK